MAGQGCRVMREGEEPEVAALIAKAFADKRAAILGDKGDWLPVVEAFITEYGGPVLVAEVDGRIAGAQAIRMGEWEPGPKTVHAVLDQLGILGGIRAKWRLNKLMATIPKLGPGEAMIDAVGVYEEHRGKGLGRALLRAGEELARKEGISTLCLCVKRDNTPALGLYKSFGFEVEHPYSNAWGDNYYMKKRMET